MSSTVESAATSSTAPHHAPPPLPPTTSEMQATSLATLADAALGCVSQGGPGQSQSQPGLGSGEGKEAGLDMASLASLKALLVGGTASLASAASPAVDNAALTQLLLQALRQNLSSQQQQQQQQQQPFQPLEDAASMHMSMLLNSLAPPPSSLLQQQQQQQQQQHALAPVSVSAGTGVGFPMFLPPPPTAHALQQANEKILMLPQQMPHVDSTKMLLRNLSMQSSLLNTLIQEMHVDEKLVNTLKVQTRAKELESSRLKASVADLEEKLKQERAKFEEAEALWIEKDAVWKAATSRLDAKKTSVQDLERVVSELKEDVRRETGFDPEKLVSSSMTSSVAPTSADTATGGEDCESISKISISRLSTNILELDAQWK
ncbi:hypothetical protein HDU99_000488 [Rhizoclosmatium hyalinum]|nr:hypothetical protein HDU99_000488 [Rhizoclosmatium hyalinum]